MTDVHDDEFEIQGTPEEREEAGPGNTSPKAGTPKDAGAHTDQSESADGTRAPPGEFDIPTEDAHASITETNASQKAAANYIERGWCPTPVQRPTKGDKNTGKSPISKGWPDLRLSAEEVEDTWAGPSPHNIGILTGKASGLVVLDFDDPATGLAWRKKHEAEAASFYIVRRSNAPPGRFHAYFKCPGGRKSAKRFAGVWELFGDGFQVVAPPSVHHTGGVYEVVNDPGELPPWENRYLPDAPPQSGSSSGTDRNTTQFDGDLSSRLPESVLTTIEQGADDGSRNDTCFRLACQLRDAGLAHPDSERLILQFAANCTPPLPKKEALTALGSAYGSPRRDPPGIGRVELVQGSEIIVSGMPPIEAPEPWGEMSPLMKGRAGPADPPWDAFPPALRDMGRSIAETFNVPGSMAAGAVLGIASVAAGNRFLIRIKDDHTQFANVYLMLAVPVAGGKSPVTNKVKAPLVEWEEREFTKWQKEHAEWEVRQRSVEIQLKGLERGLGGQTVSPAQRLEIEKEMRELKADLGDEPPRPRIYISDATSEAVARAMKDNGGCIGCVSGEARKILEIAKGRYVSKDGPDIDVWLSGHAGEEIRVGRTTKTSFTVRHACLAACVMTQPDSLRSLGTVPALRGSGFLARWLFIVVAPTIGEYPVESVPTGVAARYRDAIFALLDHGRESAEEGQGRQEIVFSETAFAAWKAFNDATKAELNAGADTMPLMMREWLAKLPETAARIALLFHAVRHVSEDVPLGVVDEAEVRNALRVAEWLRLHAEAAVTVLGASETAALGHRVWGWVSAKRDSLATSRASEGLGQIEAVKPRDLVRASIAGVPDSRTAAKVLGFLEEHGHVQRVAFRRPKQKVQTLYYLRPAASVVDPPAAPAPTDPTLPAASDPLSGKSGKSLGGVRENEEGKEDADAPHPPLTQVREEGRDLLPSADDDWREFDF